MNSVDETSDAETVIPLDEMNTSYQSPEPTIRANHPPPPPRKRQSLASFVDVLEYEHTMMTKETKKLKLRNENLEKELKIFNTIRNILDHNQCPVCYELSLEKTKIMGKCTHIICLHCYENLMEKKCPLCREKYT